MTTRLVFDQLVQDAYQHLYDFVYLRNHELARLLLPQNAAPVKERAWRLHQQLLQILDELDPGPQAPVFSHEWRRHRLMVLRYVDGLSPQETADALNVSRRHFYREQEQALAAVGDLLWERVQSCQSQPSSAPDLAEEPAINRLELLRQESVRVTTQTGAQLEQVVERITPLLAEVCRQKEIRLAVGFDQPLPVVVVEPSVLRQMVMGVLGFLLEQVTKATIRFGATVDETYLVCTIAVEPTPPGLSDQEITASQQLVTVRELAALNGVELANWRTRSASGFALQLPRDRQASVLVVDDNSDMLLFFQRLLAAHHYRVLTANGGAAAMSAAATHQPDLVILDLMMPTQDGWDILQNLRHQPATQRLPIVVCSVLHQEDLALALGADAFLEKPVNEETLLALLARLLPAS
jgi:CheY-like chemotaxis protein